MSSPDLRARGALYTQVTAELTPEQLDRYQMNGELNLSWNSLSGPARGLLLQYARDYLNIIDRSGPSRDQFVDFSQPG